MRLERIEIDRSPDRPSAVRLSGVVRYDVPFGGKTEETIWYEVPEAYAPWLSDSGDPWLAGLLPVAVVAGERLQIPRPVDAAMLDNAHAMMQVWRVCHPQRRPVAIEADVAAPAAAPPPPGRTAAFFSGGVDSFHTALRPRAAPIDDLLLVLGSFDLLSGDAATYERVRAKLQVAADALGKVLVPVTTNQMRTRMAATDAKYFSGSGMLAAAALALERRYCRVIMSSCVDMSSLRENGGQVYVTPLLSTARTRFDEEGVALSRVAKTERVALSDTALAALRVCFMSGDQTNCGECVKCLRTMIALEALGALGRAPGFVHRTLDARRVERVTVVDSHERHYYEELPPFCRAHGREDLARAVERALARSRRHDLIRPFVRWLRHFPVVGPATHRLEALVQDKGRVEYRKA